MQSSRLVLIMCIGFIALLTAAGGGCGDFGSGVGLPLDGGGGNTDTLVSFQNQILPIFSANCGGALCHTPCSPANAKSLCLATHERILASGKVIAGDAENSILVRRLEGNIAPRMPYGRPPLPDSLILLIRRWIDQGALDDTIVPPPSS